MKQEMHTILAAAAEAEARVLVLNEKCVFHSIYHRASTLIHIVIRIVELSQDLSHRITQLDAARSQQREYVPSFRLTCTVNVKPNFWKGMSLCFASMLSQSCFDTVNLILLA